MFTQNKYYTIYYNLIDRASQQKRTKNKNIYYELHHIIPKSLGGTEETTNKVYLTAKEHIVAHHLLCKITEGEHLISCMRAFHSMCFQTNGGNNKRYATVGQLAKAREYASIARRGKKGMNGAPKWSKCSSLEEWKLTLAKLTEKNMSDPEIGKIYSVSAQAIHNWRSKLDIGKRREEIRSKDWLFHQYVTLKKSSSDIAKEIGCSGTAIQHKLNLFNIPIRSASQRQQNRKAKLQ